MMLYPLFARIVQMARSTGALFLFSTIGMLPLSAMATDQPVETPAIEFVTLGTGGGPDIRKERSESANALVIGDRIYLFDIGVGAQRRLVEAGLQLNRVQAVFLSHLHIDHTGDLAPFLLTRWVVNDYRPIDIIGPRGTNASLDGVAQIAEPIRLSPVNIGGPAKPSFESTYSGQELASAMDRPTLIYADDHVRVLAIINAHYHFAPDSPEARFARSYSFRIEAGGKVYVYTGDTGVTDRLVELARDADVLVSEVIDLAGIEAMLRRSDAVSDDVLPPLLAHMREDHLTPSQIGELASRAGVKKVVLTHLVPGDDGETDLSPYTQGIAEHYDGPVTVARDLQRF